jgi:hypothetical protein
MPGQYVPAAASGHRLSAWVTSMFTCQERLVKKPTKGRVHAATMTHMIHANVTERCFVVRKTLGICVYYLVRDYRLRDTGRQLRTPGTTGLSTSNFLARALQFRDVHQWIRPRPLVLPNLRGSPLVPWPVGAHVPDHLSQFST